MGSLLAKDSLRARRPKFSGQLVGRKMSETSPNLAWKIRVWQEGNERGGVGFRALPKKMKQSSGKSAADITLDFSFRLAYVRGAHVRESNLVVSTRIRVLRGFPSNLPLRLRRSRRVQFVERTVSSRSRCRQRAPVAARFQNQWRNCSLPLALPSPSTIHSPPVRYRSYFSADVCDRQTIPAGLDGHSAFRREFGSGARRVPFVCRAALV